MEEQQIAYKLEAFEGPLDLLLTLIEKNKVDICDIPIAEITDQYVAFVEQSETEDLDLLSDYLVMASTLLIIKSKMLLPPEEDENGEEIDPREELARRLAEYKEYKETAEELREFYDSTEGILFKSESLPEEVKKYRPPVDYDRLLKDVTVLRMKEIFESVLRRQEEKIDPVRADFREIEREPVRISDKFKLVMKLSKKTGRVSFRNLLKDQKSKADIVVTFLACLELIRMGQIFVEQKESADDFDLTWNENCETTITEEEMEEYE